MKAKLQYLIRRIDVADSDLAPKPQWTKVWHAIELYVFKYVDLSDSVREKTVLKGRILVRYKLISGQKYLFVKIVRDVALLEGHCIWGEII